MELAYLRSALQEAQDTLNAIRSGEVDAVLVNGAHGSQIYSLASADQPYRIYVESMQEGAVTVAADSVILYCNQKFADLIQVPLERVIGSPLAAFLGAEAWGQVSTVFSRESEVVRYESALSRDGGHLVPIKLTANRLPQPDQTLMCLVVTDLTEQRGHEATRLAKDLAEKASLAKDDFLAALSHEMRTPLTPVLMAAGALTQNMALPAEVRDTLEMICRNVELEARLIDDLLDLTRITKGKLELQQTRVDLHSVITRAVEICQSEFIAKSQMIVLKLEAKQHVTVGDPVRLQQVVWNLSRNAAKFTPENGLIIIRTSNPSGEKILLEIEDNGMGFEPDSAEKLFNAFEQGGRQITRQFGGLGLGLTITRSIVQAHQGTISARSRGAGKGAIFSFEIPLRAVVVETQSAPSAAASSTVKSTKRILLVEDHADTRQSLEFLLRKADHHVLSAGTAGEALRLAEEHGFDLVISDIGLPDQNGLDLMRVLKERFQIPGIGLSGYGMEEDVARSVEAGFVHYLTKPVKFADLKRVISLL